MGFIGHFSSWTRLRRAVGWLHLFKRLLLGLGPRRRQLKEALNQSSTDEEQLEKRLREEMQSVKAQAIGKGPLSIEEFVRAEKAIVCFCQRRRFLD